MPEVVTSGPSSWSAWLARAAYAVMAVVLLGPSLVSIVRVMVGHCDHVPNLDGKPGGEYLVVCGRLDEVPVLAVIAGLFAAAAAVWIRARSDGRSLLAGVGILVGGIPFFAPLYAVIVVSVGLRAPIPPLTLAGAVALAVLGLLSAATLARDRLRGWDGSAAAPQRPPP